MACYERKKQWLRVIKMNVSIGSHDGELFGGGKTLLNNFVNSMV
jgi:hypothetical protein